MAAYYKILGLRLDASDVEIRKRYKTLALRYHPDKNRQPRAEANFKAIKLAYDFITKFRREKAQEKEKEKAKADQDKAKADQDKAKETNAKESDTNRANENGMYHY